MSQLARPKSAIAQLHLFAPTSAGKSYDRSYIKWRARAFPVGSRAIIMSTRSVQTKLSLKSEPSLK